MNNRRTDDNGQSEKAKEVPNSGRVVITGLGAVNPVGLKVMEMWQALTSGKSGIDYITRFDPTPFKTRYAAEVKDFDPTEYVDRKEADRMERFSQFAVAASLQAAEQARLKISDDVAEETGVIIGNIICGMLQVVKQLEVLHRSGPNLVSPILAPIMTGDAAGIQVTLKLGAKGPNYALSSACCSGLDSIGLAYDTIRHGEAKVMIAGGSEAPLTPIAIAAFNAARLLTTKNGKPENICRPFDAERDGFVLGEGAAILVMEELNHALERGAPILAEVVAYSANSDAFHMTQPAPEGKGGIRALERALKRAGIGPEDVDYISAYGAATVLNDKTETEVIKSVFGEYAYRIPISATKSMTGHLLGAAGSTQAVVTVMALNHGMLPPTINLHNPDPECDLDYIPNEARQADIKTAICNSFGFGGHNTVLVLKKFEQ